jgi:hypothetical protein
MDSRTFDPQEAGLGEAYTLDSDEEQCSTLGKFLARQRPSMIHLAILDNLGPDTMRPLPVRSDVMLRPRFRLFIGTAE